MTRERSPSGPVLQRAYGVLDKYKISRTFFVKTDQDNCETKAEPEEVDENLNPGYDIVVDDEEVLNEYYNGVPAESGYYRQSQPLNKSADTKEAEPVAANANAKEGAALAGDELKEAVKTVAQEPASPAAASVAPVPAPTAETPEAQLAEQKSP